MPGRSMEEIKQKILSRQANVIVIGLGYVGLPLAVENGKAGFQVIGIDKDYKKVELLNAGKNYIPDVNKDDLKKLVQRDKISATSKYHDLGWADVIIICVPTPLTATRDPDISQIVTVTEEIAKHLRRGQLVTLESTTYPGTTQEVVLPKLEATGLKVGVDYFLAFSPERVDPGNKRFRTKNISKVVGGVTSDCLDLALIFYLQTIKQVVPVSSPAAAEMTKIFENTYRSVNIALVNELMYICDRMGLDVWEIVEAAGTKPFGFQTFYPGPGVGGHCIPIDPFYLTWKARQYDFYSNLIELAAQTNIRASYYVADKVSRVLSQSKQSIRGARVLVLGAAYKKDVNDSRESPAIKIMSILSDDGADVVYHDPYVSSVALASKRPLQSVALTVKEVAGADCVLIATDHSCFDYQWIVDNAVIVVDARNATKDLEKGREKVVKI